MITEALAENGLLVAGGSVLPHLMLRTGARPDVTRHNMGYANIDVTQNIYGRSWWTFQVEAVTRTVAAVAQSEPSD